MQGSRPVVLLSTDADEVLPSRVPGRAWWISSNGVAADVGSCRAVTTGRPLSSRMWATSDSSGMKPSRGGIASSRSGVQEGDDRWGDHPPGALPVRRVVAIDDHAVKRDTRPRTPPLRCGAQGECFSVGQRRFRTALSAYLTSSTESPGSRSACGAGPNLHQERRPRLPPSVVRRLHQGRSGSLSGS